MSLTRDPTIFQQHLAINEYINSPLNTICRLCLNKFDLTEFEDLFESFPLSQGETVAEYVEKFADIRISKDDVFSKVLCKYCLGRLNEAANLKKVIYDCNEFLNILHACYGQLRGQSTVSNRNQSETQTIKSVIRQSEENIRHIEEEIPKNNDYSNSILYNLLKAGQPVKENSKIDIVESNVIDDSLMVKVELSEDFIEENVSEKKEAVSECKSGQKYWGEENSKYPCKDCRKIFIKSTHLIRHIKACHKCEDCGERFKTKKLLTQHRMTHKKNVALECEKCEKQFWNSSTFDYHLETHADNPKYQCTLCGKRFVHYRGLDSHKRCHLKRIERKCPVCQKIIRSYQSNALNIHMRMHLRNCGDKCRKIELKKTHNPIKSYTCTICNREFGCLRLFKGHTKILHGTREK